MTLLALDAATKTGWAVLTEASPQPHLLAHGTVFAETTAIEQLAERARALGVVTAVIESPYLDKNPKTLIALAITVGRWAHALSRLGIPAELVTADVWQQGALRGLIQRTSKRADRKRAARFWVRCVYRLEVSEDEADAIAFGSWAVRSRAFGARAGAAQ
jgi:Holliday junction resolvasome RuvABC endonuclease subunit